jgi:hypothetical protein
MQGKQNSQAVYEKVRQVILRTKFYRYLIIRTAHASIEKPPLYRFSSLLMNDWKKITYMSVDEEPFKVVIYLLLLEPRS